MEKRSLMPYIVLLLLLFSPSQATTAAEDNGDDNAVRLLCLSLAEAEKASDLSATERYEDKYNDFSKALSKAERPYNKLLQLGPGYSESALVSLFEDYREAQEFWRAYMNDRVFVKRQDRTMEPTYLIDRDLWPERLESRFPGLISEVGEKDEKGDYISGDKALEYIFMKLSKRLKALGC